MLGRFRDRQDASSLHVSWFGESLAGREEDNAQRIYDKQRGKPFSFMSVRVQAQGRTTILKINYGDTRQILQTASAMAIALLRPQANTAGYRPLC